MSIDIVKRIREGFPELAVQMDAVPDQLAPGWLKAVAAGSIGSDDFGPDIFEDPLARLCVSANEDANLNPYGRMLLAAIIKTQLENRLLMQRLRTSGAPELSQKVIPPIIVTGLPRTGTTFLHRLLAADPDHASLPYWQLNRPIPRNNEDTPEKRIAEANTMLGVRQKITPELDATHMIRAEAPEECMWLTASSMQSRVFWNVAPVYGFMDWYNQADRTAKYREYFEFLSYLQAYYPGKRFVLKAPDHVDGLCELLDVFPEALVVQTHRDMGEQIGSYLSLGRITRKLGTETLDPGKETEAVLALTDSSIRRNLAAREHHPGKILDVRYTDLIADPHKTVARIYDWAGLPFTGEYQSNLRQHQQQNRQGKHGEHNYQLSDFGLSVSQISDRYAAYSAKFL